MADLNIMTDKELARLQLAACAMAALLQRLAPGGVEQGYAYAVYGPRQPDLVALASDSFAVADTMLEHHKRTWEAMTREVLPNA